LAEKNAAKMTYFVWGGMKKYLSSIIILCVRPSASIIHVLNGPNACWLSVAVLGDSFWLFCYHVSCYAYSEPASYCWIFKQF